MRGKEYCHGFGGFSGSHGFGPSPNLGSFEPRMASGATQPGSGTVRDPMAVAPPRAPSQASGSLAAPRPTALATNMNMGTPRSSSVRSSGNSIGTAPSPSDTSTMSMATPKAAVNRSGVRAMSANPARDARLRLEGQNQTVAPRSAPDAASGTGNDKAVRNLLGY